MHISFMPPTLLFKYLFIFLLLLEKNIWEECFCAVPHEKYDIT